MNNKSPRNKTIDISVDEGKQYLERCVKGGCSFTLDELLNKTLYGDAKDVLRGMPAKCVDLAIIDPPYNLDKNFHGNTFSKRGIDNYFEYIDDWVELVLPVLKDTASIYVCCDWFSSISIGRLLADKMMLRNRITWQREKGRGAKFNWKSSMEDIWYATVSNDFTFNVDAVKQRKKVIAPYKLDGEPRDWEETPDGKFRDTYPSNFWDDITVPYWSMVENTSHPTQKPEKLLAKLILASSNEGDIVLDPFLGSGSTSVTAKKLGRQYIGIEQNPLYCIWSERRLELAEQDNCIQGFRDGVFWERNSGICRTAKASGEKRIDDNE